MADVRYAPGSRPTVVTDRGVVVVGAELPASLATQLWERVAAGRGLAAVIEVLTGAFGASFDAIPPFAVALVEEGFVRVAVRGALALSVETGSASETTTGIGVTTWTERIVAGAVRVTIAPPDGSALPAELPVRDGVVLASAVDWPLETATDAGSARDPQAAPSVPPVTPAAPTAPRGPWSKLSSASASASASAPAPAEPLADSTSAPAPDSAPVPPVPEPEWPGLIESIPTGEPGDTWLPADATFAPEAGAEGTGQGGEPSGATTGYDHLWGVTVLRSVEDAAIRDDDEDEAAAAPGDHDGETISVAQARALRGARHDDSVPPLAPPRRPAPGSIRLSTGQVLVLDRTVVIGRRPRSTRVTGTDLPHLVAVDSPQQDISRSHLELRVEGDSILATDLRTTNGSMLDRPGTEPVRLHPGEPTVVVAGDVIDLGDGITVTIQAPGADASGIDASGIDASGIDASGIDAFGRGDAS